jgi:hypothetical protein
VGTEELTSAQGTVQLVDTLKSLPLNMILFINNKYLIKHLSNILAEWCALLFRIRQVLGSDLGPVAGYPD